MGPCVRRDDRNNYLAGINVGPTVRIDLSPGGGVTPVVPPVSAGGGTAAASAGAAPFLAAADFGTGACCGRAIFFALSSVTMISPCCSESALSSTFFSASVQLWPTALQAQVGVNS